MADPFIAEIRIFGFNFAPRGWAFCSGQLMPISQNTALFSLLSTNYGGDGRATFGLPDLQGRAPMMPGQGSGLSLYDLGQTGGSETVTLLPSEIPAHTHAMRSFNDLGEDHIPGPSEALARPNGGSLYAPPTALTAMAPGALASTGGNQPHNNMMPYLTANFCIALQGVFPPRS